MSEIRILESSPLVIEVEDDDGNLVARTAALGVSGMDSDWSLRVCEERDSPDAFGMKEVPREDGGTDYCITIGF